MLVGGADHKTGQDPDPGRRWDDLEQWTRERFPQFGGVTLAFAFLATLGRLGLVTLLLREWLGINIYALGFNLLSFWGLTLTYLFFQIPLMVLIVTPALDGLRRDTAAHDALEAAIDPVIRPAIADATLAGMGVLIAYGPDEEVVARPSNAVRPGQALLIRTDRLRVDNPLPPITFVGANT